MMSFYDVGRAIKNLIMSVVRPTVTRFGYRPITPPQGRSDSPQSPTESDQSLRDRNPGLQELWNQYQTMLQLVDDRPRSNRPYPPPPPPIRSPATRPSHLCHHCGNGAGRRSFIPPPQYQRGPPAPPKKMKREGSEADLRKRKPALQDAWEQYQSVLKLVDDRPLMETKMEDYYFPPGGGSGG
jgi:hypothetical protein